MGRRGETISDVTRIFATLALLAVLPGAARAQVVISQVYGGGGATSGTPSYRNDYIELFNRGTAAAPLTGLSVQYASATGGTWQMTVLSGSLAPGQYHLVQQGGGLLGAALPAPDSTGALNMSATSGKVALVNGTAALTGACPTENVLDLVGYGETASCAEGSPTAALDNTRAAVRNGGGCVDTGDNRADFSIVAGAVPRNTASAGNACTAPRLAITTASPLPPVVVNTPYRQQLTASGGSGTYTWTLGAGSRMPRGVDVSPGGLVGGTPLTAGTFRFNARVTDTSTPPLSGERGFELRVEPPASCEPATAIHKIQGAGGESPYDGSFVETGGVVTAVRSNGFFIQAPEAETDADPNTSEGLFVFTGSPVPPQAAVGSKVCVAGLVEEFRPAADPASRPLTEINGPALVAVAGEGNGLPAPVTLTAADTPPDGGLDVLERYEGMRVRVECLRAVSPTGGSERNSSGATANVFYGVVDGVARPFREEGIQLPDPLPEEAPRPNSIPRFDTNPERLRVDTAALRGAARLDVTSGALVRNLAGPLTYDRRTYTILAEPAAEASGLATASPAPEAGADEIAVASMNLQQFARPDAVRLAKASLAIRDVLRMPDVIGVQEVGTLADLQALAAKINSDAEAAGQGAPAYAAYLEEGNDPGGIDVGFLVRTSRVTVKDVTQAGKTATYVNPRTNEPETLHDRPPLALRASRDGFAFTVIVNHFRSLLDLDDPADGPRVRAKRNAQAAFLAAMVQERQSSDPGERILVVGDFNAYHFNDGFVDVMGAVRGAPSAADRVVTASDDLVSPDLVNLGDGLEEGERYSYVYSGDAQTLDHILVTANLADRVARFAYVRLNADFPEAYRAEAGRPERVSDHDAALAHVRTRE